MSDRNSVKRISLGLKADIIFPTVLRLLTNVVRNISALNMLRWMRGCFYQDISVWGENAFPQKYWIRRFFKAHAYPGSVDILSNLLCAIQSKLCAAVCLDQQKKLFISSITRIGWGRGEEIHEALLKIFSRRRC